jgi:hypothetical protein
MKNGIPSRMCDIELINFAKLPNQLKNSEVRWKKLIKFKNRNKKLSSNLNDSLKKYSL